MENSVEMESMKEKMDTLKKMTVRAWWADGLWDFVVAGFFGMMAVFFYYFTVMLMFPTSRWPWPINFLVQDERVSKVILIWLIGFLIVSAIYAYLSFLIVKGLKTRYIAPITGDVRHTFFLPVETRVWVGYLVLYVVSSFILVVINSYFLNAERIFSVYMTTAPAAIFFMIGKNYWLKRYVLFAALGLLICTGLEWFAVSNAVGGLTPPNFWQASPECGNPAIPLLVWTVIMIVSGVCGLVLTKRGFHAAGE